MQRTWMLHPAPPCTISSKTRQGLLARYQAVSQSDRNPRRHVQHGDAATMGIPMIRIMLKIALVACLAGAGGRIAIPPPLQTALPARLAALCTPRTPDMSYLQLLAERDHLSRDIEQLRLKYTDAHPYVRAAKDRLDDIEAELAGEPTWKLMLIPLAPSYEPYASHPFYYPDGHGPPTHFVAPPAAKR